jgi:uncharacterized protein with HEPN domain
MPRRVDHVLHDILQAIERIEEVTRGKTLAEFEGSWQLRWLVHGPSRLSPRRAALFPTS